MSIIRAKPVLDRPPSDQAASAEARASREAASRAERRAEFLEVQNAVVGLIAAGATPGQTLAPLLDWLMVGGEIDHGAIFLFNAEGNRVSMAAPRAMPAPVQAALDALTLRADDDPFGMAARDREPVFVTNGQGERRWPAFSSLMAALGLRSAGAYPILSPGGEMLGVLAILRRRTGWPSDDAKAQLDAIGPIAKLAIEHHRRRLALDQADERFNSLTASLPGVVYQRVISPDGDIHYTYISEGARELFGVPPAEVLDNPNSLFDCLGAGYRASLRDNLLAAARDLRIWDVEVPVIARDGKRKWTHARARPHRRPDGSVVWNGLILDATQLKEANLALAAANRAKSEFLANMSHELRTPLNAIIGFSEMMGQELLGPMHNKRYQQYAADIYQSGTHLLEIINDILDLAKVEAGRLELNEDVVDFSRTIEAGIRLVRPRAEQRKIELVTVLAKEPLCLRGDDRKLKQILANLLSNAVKFTPDGGRITIEAGRGDGGGLAVKVRDTGVGMAPELIPTLCQPFAQADSGLNRKYEGTGLGLPLTKAMVELHGGSLAIESEPGVGTCVTVTLPGKRMLTAGPAPAGAK